MAWLIKSATLITAAETFEADILVDGEQIAAIGANLQAPGAPRSTPAQLVMPGGVDPHVHCTCRCSAPFRMITIRAQGGCFWRDDQ
jgi:dihydroorotase-like cyclic amidohydrolase